MIVLHDSLLPRYRGFNPLVTALQNGDTTIGVTAVFAGREYDRGEIIGQSSSTIAYPIRIRDAISAVIPNYLELAIRVARSLAEGGALHATPQNDATASYSLWRDEEDYAIEWSASGDYIKRFVDSVGYPYKGALAIMDGAAIRVLDAETVEDVAIENRTPGKVIFVRDGMPVVVCGKGLLMIKEAVDDATRKSVLPLSRFRVRFKGADR